MGRSRGNFHAEEDPTQRSRRKKSSANGENTEFLLTGQGTSDGNKALYHCNYCNKDITGRVRIKCAACSDFDLCVECFSVGAEVQPHKSDHPYRVMDVLSFSLICPEWNAEEELLLLEGLEMYGMGNWAEVAEHVGTKTKSACIEHYKTAFIDSPCFPLPDMSRVVGKNRDELLAMAKDHHEEKRGDLQLKEESPFAPSRVKVEDSYKSSPSARLPSTSMAGAKVNKRATDLATVKDQSDLLKMEDHMSGRSFGGKKPNSATPSLMEASGYNAKRNEFDPEYDNDAEQLLADMEFKETDTEEEVELKLRVLRIYSRRLDERKRRKDFVLERGLLHPSPFMLSLTQEERELCRKYDPFMRFHSKEEHEELLDSIVSEHRIMKRIKELKEARAHGCRTPEEADRYLERKRREAEDRAHQKEGFQAGQSSQESFTTVSNMTPSGQANSSTQTKTDFVSVPGAHLLSESEMQLCREIRLAPSEYLKVQEEIATQILSGNIAQKSDAHSLFQIEPAKVDRVYDMVLKKGILP